MAHAPRVNPIAITSTMNQRTIAAAFALAIASRAHAQADSIPPLSLGDAMRLAAKQSYPAVAATYRVDQARARATEVRSALLPEVTAIYSDGQRTFNTASFGLPLPGFDPNGEIIGPVRTIDVRARFLAQLIDPAGVGRYRTARSAASGAVAEVSVATNQVAAAAANSYVRALRAEAQVGARAADSSLAADLLGIAQRQLSAGVGVALDVTRARAQLATTRAQLIAARSERDRSRLDLARALGLSPTVGLILRDSLVTTDSAGVPSEDAAIAAALNDRPDLRAAAVATQTARSAVKAARSERLPKLGVFGDNGTTSNTYPNLLGTYTWGVQLQVPVFEGSRISAHVQQQVAGLRDAEARRHDVELQVATDVRGALLDLSSSREQVGAARERVMLGEQELAQSRERFRAGVAGNADVITAQLNLDAARSQYIDALAAHELARVSLARAQGHLLEMP
ncbi:MAG TPA: TolC family protein [Gemmatimonadaceae bacterium]|nr:TolC family protein [Gemmatimonadaceae bacterium]